MAQTMLHSNRARWGSVCSSVRYFIRRKQKQCPKKRTFPCGKALYENSRTILPSPRHLERPRRGVGNHRAPVVYLPRILRVAFAQILERRSRSTLHLTALEDHFPRVFAVPAAQTGERRSRHPLDLAAPVPDRPRVLAVPSADILHLREAVLPLPAQVGVPIILAVPLAVFEICNKHLF